MSCIHSVPAWLGLLTISAAFLLNIITVGSPNWADNIPIPEEEQSEFVEDVDDFLQGTNITESPIPPSTTPEPSAGIPAGIAKRALPIGIQEQLDRQTGARKTDTFLPQVPSNLIHPSDYQQDPPTEDPGSTLLPSTATPEPVNFTSIRIGVFEMCENDQCRPLSGDELEGWYMALQAFISIALLLDASACVIGLVLAVCPSCCDPGCCDSLFLWAQCNLFSVIISFVCGVISQVLFAAEGLQWDFLQYRLHFSWAFSTYFGVVFLHILAAILYFCELKRIQAERTPYLDIGSFLEAEQLYNKDQKQGYHHFEEEVNQFCYDRN